MPHIEQKELTDTLIALAECARELTFARLSKDNDLLQTRPTAAEIRARECLAIYNPEAADLGKILMATEDNGAADLSTVVTVVEDNG